MTRVAITALVVLSAVAHPAAARQFGPDDTDVQAMCAATRTGRALLERSARKRAAGSGSGFDATFYDIRLDLTLPPFGSIAGTTIVRGRSTADSLETLTLDFDPALRVDSVWSADGRGLAFSRDGAILSVRLDPPAPAGAPVAVVTAYGGMPRTSGFGGFVVDTLSGGGVVAWTLSEPYGARSWWPSVDHPSDKADSVAMQVTAPASWTVASNGLLREVVPAGPGANVWSWTHGYPIATYLVSIAAGVYDQDVQTYVRPDSLADAYGPASFPIEHFAYPGSGLIDGWSSETGWRRVVDVMPVQEWWFGPYPFAAEKYGHAQFSWGGGMEHQTVSSMGGAYLGLVAHELAHQWFGDAVGPRTWPHLWLNEGFATMAELLTWRTLADRYPGNYAAVFDLYYARALHARGTLVLADTTDVYDMFAASRVYSKGAMVLHMLRSMVGDPVFRDILRTYAGDPDLRYGTATTDDFRRVAEAVSGRDLDAFFRQWVTEGTGYPVYEASWTSRLLVDGWTLELVLRQTQGPDVSNVPVFEMPVHVRITTETGIRDVVVHNAARVQSWSIPLQSAPIGVAIDPERRILRHPSVLTVDAEGDPDPPPRVLRLTTVHPNPASDRFYVTLDAPAGGTATLEVLDVTGRRVSMRRVDGPAGSRRIALDASGWAPGLYMVRASFDGRTEARPVVVAR